TERPTLPNSPRTWTRASASSADGGSGYTSKTLLSWATAVVASTAVKSAARTAIHSPGAPDRGDRVLRAFTALSTTTLAPDITMLAAGGSPPICAHPQGCGVCSGGCQAIRPEHSKRKV